ncbi:hypothetical protein [Allobaculum fili]|uniref:hypothetical protein n=1 Tax=Allobaculum TaxID=174708 RepID=UPI001E4AB9BF|nr:hypothetical protein [Allobaculum fili]
MQKGNDNTIVCTSSLIGFSSKSGIVSIRFSEIYAGGRQMLAELLEKPKKESGIIKKASAAKIRVDILKESE